MSQIKDMIGKKIKIYRLLFIYNKRHSKYIIRGTYGTCKKKIEGLIKHMLPVETN